MAENKVVYDNGHWQVSLCPHGNRVHLRSLHGSDPFPLCWSREAVYSLFDTLKVAILSIKSGMSMGTDPDLSQEHNYNPLGIDRTVDRVIKKKGV